MQWLHEHGLISDYDGYGDLPYTVLEDARLLMEAEAMAAKMEAHR